MSQVQPPQAAGSEQPRQPERQQSASPGRLRDSAQSAARRTRPSDSGAEASARHPGLGQHSSSQDSEIRPSESADDRWGPRHEHRHGLSHGRRAHAWPNATQEQRATRAEWWLSDAGERPPRALTARNPQFSVDSQARKGAPRPPQEPTKLGWQLRGLADHERLELELMGWQTSPPAKQSCVCLCACAEKSVCWNVASGTEQLASLSQNLIGEMLITLQSRSSDLCLVSATPRQVPVGQCRSRRVNLLSSTQLAERPSAQKLPDRYIRAIRTEHHFLMSREH